MNECVEQGTFSLGMLCQEIDRGDAPRLDLITGNEEGTIVTSGHLKSNIFHS